MQFQMNNANTYTIFLLSFKFDCCNFITCHILKELSLIVYYNFYINVASNSFFFSQSQKLIEDP